MTYFRQADGLRYYLEARYEEKPDEFPVGLNYTENYKQIEDYMNKHVHPSVGIGACIHGDGLLNDHGKEHVAMVIDRAMMLLEDKHDHLNGLELYVLLVAMHFHDVGNILGRESHEEKIFEIVDRMDSILPDEIALTRFIVSIATAHGGKINNSKDTISPLNDEDYFHGKLIRPQLLASILRFADEIADDKTRACRFLEKIGVIPPKNQVFHCYSMALQAPAIIGNNLIFKFDISEDLVTNKCTKEDSKSPDGCTSIYLYDEILLRITKCLCELEYCKRYSPQLIHLNTIQADITVSRPHVMLPIYQDSFKMKLTGYPDREICASECFVNPPKSIDGDDLKRYVTEGMDHG